MAASDSSKTSTSDKTAAGQPVPDTGSTSGVKAAEGVTGNVPASNSPASPTTEAPSASGDRAVDQGAIDPTDPTQAGDATVIVDDPNARDWSDPQQNGNVGYSAEGQVVSNQQGEQHNTVQASEDERAEVQEMKADTAASADPFTNPTVTNPA